MKVLYLNPTVAIGGAERALLDIVSGVDRRKVTPLAACVSEGPLPDALRKAGAEVTINPFPSFALKIGRGSLLSKLLLPLAALALLPHLLRLARLVRREEITVIHTNGLKSNVVGSAVRLLTGCRLVWHVRDVLAPGIVLKAFNILARLTVDRLVANSKTVADTFTGMPDGRRAVIFDGVDTDRFAPGPAREEVRRALGIEEGDLVIGAMGALAPLKGHVHLIRAMPAILDRHPSARAVILGQEMYLTVGHGGYRQVLEEEARKLNLESKVVLAGFREDPEESLRCMDLLVHSSIHPESFGLVVAEAMACGVPVVATALGGPTEIIADESQGLLVRAESPGEIASAVIRLLDDAEMRARMARDGRTRIEETFGLKRLLGEVEELYSGFEA